jgi:hypothetical protein
VLELGGITGTEEACAKLAVAYRKLAVAFMKDPNKYENV